MSPFTTGHVVPDPGEVTYDEAIELAKLYRSTLEGAYKDSNDQKIKKGIDDDNWRYEELPAIVRDRKKKEKGGAFLEMKELERLVAWKIKHGKNRPFLIGMIRKNEASAVKDVTQSVFSFVPDTPTIKDIQVALKGLNKIKGVGPATGSLLLSVYMPDRIPFFEDELYGWLCQTDSMSKGSEIKLKYNVKEYEEVYHAVRGLRERLKDSSGVSIPASTLEKVAFVVANGGTADSVSNEVIEESVSAEKPASAQEKTRPLNTASKTGKSFKKRSADEVAASTDSIRRSSRRRK